jgi:hypothetical protein
MSVRHLLATAVTDPVAASTYTMSAGRIGAVVGGVLGLAGVVLGVLALRRRTTNGRAKGTVAVVLALAGMVIGGVVVATSDSGIGTGNGRGGAYVALVVGLAGLVLGGLALGRSRRLTSR